MQPRTIIIGAGIIGLTIARELHLRGERNLLLVDRGPAGREASWAAAGMLSPQAEAHVADDFFRFCCEARTLYPTFAAELLDETGVDIELDQTGTMQVTFSDERSSKLAERFEWQRKAGLEVERLSFDEIRELEPSISPSVRDGLLFPNDWQVENRKLVEALLEYARRNRIEILENTEARDLIHEAGEIRGIDTSAGRWYCDRAVMTAGAWTTRICTLPFRVKPIRGQMVCFRPEKSLLKHVVQEPNGYLVPRKDGRILAGATVEDVGFENMVTDGAVNSLQEMALEILPSLGNLNITESWSGLRPFASDGFPVLGRVPGIKNLTVATGHYRNGILLAPLTAKLIADEMIDGLVSPYLSAFGADRFARRNAGSI
jgi:glycine oxidase